MCYVSDAKPYWYRAPDGANPDGAKTEISNTSGEERFCEEYFFRAAHYCHWRGGKGYVHHKLLYTSARPCEYHARNADGLITAGKFALLREAGRIETPAELSARLQAHHEALEAKADAHKLHVQLGRRRVGDHGAFAARALGLREPVEHSFCAFQRTTAPKFVVT